MWLNITNTTYHFCIVHAVYCRVVMALSLKKQFPIVSQVGRYTSHPVPRGDTFGIRINTLEITLTSFLNYIYHFLKLLFPNKKTTTTTTGIEQQCQINLPPLVLLCSTFSVYIYVVHCWSHFELRLWLSKVAFDTQIRGCEKFGNSFNFKILGVV